MPADTQTRPARPHTRRDIPGSGLTVADVALRYRVSAERVRNWIRKGEIFAINTADAKCSKPRYVIPPESLVQFERGRSAAEPPKPTRRKKQRTGDIDFYPGD